jgi:enoyl reductase-like protein
VRSNIRIFGYIDNINLIIQGPIAIKPIKDLNKPIINILLRLRDIEQNLR